MERLEAITKGKEEPYYSFVEAVNPDFDANIGDD